MQFSVFVALISCILVIGVHSQTSPPAPQTACPLTDSCTYNVMGCLFGGVGCVVVFSVVVNLPRRVPVVQQ